MSWNHRGTEIDLHGASFVAKVGDKNVRRSSVNAVKKAIDKYLDAKAQEVAINLPVVVRIEAKGYYSDLTKKPKDRLIHRVITGIDADSKEIQGLEIPDGWRLHEVLPDSPANTKRLEILIDAEIAKKQAEEAIEGRSVRTLFGGRSNNSYSEALELLKKSYEPAKKAESND